MHQSTLSIFQIYNLFSLKNAEDREGSDLKNDLRWYWFMFDISNIDNSALSTDLYILSDFEFYVHQIYPIPVGKTCRITELGNFDSKIFRIPKHGKHTIKGL
jgi:hypothetical protein